MPADKKSHRSPKSNRLKRVISKSRDVVSRFGRRVSKAFGALTEQIENRFKILLQEAGSNLSMLFSILVPRSLRKKVDGLGKSNQAQQLGKQVGELTEKVEKQFTTGATSAWKVLGLFVAILVPHFIRERVAKTWKSFWKSIARFFKRSGKRINKLVERYLPSWLVKGIKRASTRVRRATRNTTTFLGAWWKTRDFNKLAWSTPAILMFVPLVACLALAAAYTSGDKIRHYRRVMIAADRESTTETADLFRRKLKQLGYLRMESAEYVAALQLAETGDYDGAYERMKKIALVESPDGNQATPTVQTAPPAVDDPLEKDPQAELGYLPAHHWIINSLMRHNISEGSEEEDWNAIKQHVSIAKQIDRDDDATKYYQIRIDERDGINVVAKKVELSDKYPLLSFELMMHYRRTGKTREMRTYARRYVRHIEGLAKELRKASQWAGLWQAQQLLGEQAKAQTVALDAYLLYRDDPTIKKAAGAVLLSQLRQMDANDPRFLPTLKKAHAADETNVFIAGQLANRLVHGPDGDQLLKDLRKEKRCSSTVFLLAGDSHADARNWEQAEAMYREAIEVDPGSGKGHNNVAWILANIPPLRLQKALESVNMALNLDENEAEYLETRGQIYVKLERWNEAANDLERALNGVLPRHDLQKAHESLVKVYEHLGQLERAAAHRLQTVSSTPESEGI